jgi:acyl-CoA thioesterase-1
MWMNGALIALMLPMAPPDAAAPAQVTMAFPGQWAAPPAGGYPLSPKGCLTRFPAEPQRSACLDAIGKDWSRLSRYAVANRELPPPGRGERRVVFFGDSITDNWHKPEHGGFFTARGLRAMNRGIGGQTTVHMLGRFRSDVVALAPQAVVILAGTNDLTPANATPPEVIQGNLASMAELARAHGIRVVMATLLPVCDCKQTPEGKPITRTVDRPATAITALNRWIGEYAGKNGHGVADYYRAFADQAGALKADLTYDGLHPNAAGYRVMAEVAGKAIAAALRSGAAPVAGR